MSEPRKFPSRRAIRTFAGYVLGILCVANAHAQTSVDGFEVGGVTIQAPALEGFKEISDVSPEMMELAQAMVPPTNRLLGVYLSDADHEKLVGGEPPAFDRYVFIQVHRELEDKSLSGADFREIAAQLKTRQSTIQHEVEKQAGRLIDNASEKISESYDVSLDMELGEQRSLGIFLDRPNAVAFTSLVKYRGNLNGESFDYVMAGSTLLMKVRRRLLYAYVYSEYEGQADVDWVESRTTTLADRILAANDSPDGGLGVALLSVMDYANVVSSSVIGVILGAFLVLMFVLFGASKRRAAGVDGDP